MSKESSVYASIVRPTYIRKGILTTVQDSLNLVKRYKTLYRLSETRVEQIRDLRELLEEINVLVQRLRTILPTVAEKDFQTKEVKKTIEVSENKTKKIHPIKAKIEFIENELDKIENKIKNI